MPGGVGWLRFSSSATSSQKSSEGAAICHEQGDHKGVWTKDERHSSKHARRHYRLQRPRFSKHQHLRKLQRHQPYRFSVQNEVQLGKLNSQQGTSPKSDHPRESQASAKTEKVGRLQRKAINCNWCLYKVETETESFAAPIETSIPPVSN